VLSAKDTKVLIESKLAWHSHSSADLQRNRAVRLESRLQGNRQTSYGRLVPLRFAS